MALLYATISLSAEIHFSAAWNTSKTFAEAAEHLRMANVLFPLEYRIRNSVAFLYVAGTPANTSLDEAIVKTKQAIANNPYAADLHGNMLKLYAMKGDMAAAHNEFDIIKRIAPQSELIRMLEKAGLK